MTTPITSGSIPTPLRTGIKVPVKLKPPTLPKK